jgi:putative ABC transport system permease protein
MNWASQIKTAWRSVARAPLAPICVVLVIGTGIAAATVTYAILDAVILHPIPLHGIDRVVSLIGAGDPPEHDRLQWWGQAPALESVALYASGGANLSGTGPVSPRHILLTSVTRDFFPVFEVGPILGAGFRGDSTSKDGREVILSEALWRASFQGAAVLGSTVELNGLPATVVGIMPGDFRFPGGTGAWILDDRRELVAGLGDDGNAGISGRSGFIGRLRDGATVAEVQAQARTLQERLRQMYEPNSNWRSGLPVRVETLVERIVGRSRNAFTAAFVLACLLLVVTCCNAGGVLVARMMGRRKEIAIRVALGGGYGAIIAATVAECVMMCAGAALLGVTASWWALLWVRRAFSGLEPLLGDAALRPGVLSAAMLFVLFSMVVLGLLCSVSVLQGRVLDPLKDHAQVSSRAIRGRLRSLLALAQCAATFVLIVAQVAAVEQLAHLSSVRPGFDAVGASMADVSPPAKLYPSEGEVLRFQREILTRLSAEGSASESAVVDRAPLSGKGGRYLYADIAGQPVMVSFSNFAGDYFRLLRIPVLGWVGSSAAEKTVVVNVYLSSRIAPLGSAVGRYLQLEGEGGPRRIVAVVGDTKADTLEDEAVGQVYLPYSEPYRSQPVDRSMTILNREPMAGAGESLSLLRKRIGEVDANLAVFDAQSGRDLMEDSRAAGRLRAKALTWASTLRLRSEDSDYIPC